MTAGNSTGEGSGENTASPVESGEGTTPLETAKPDTENSKITRIRDFCDKIRSTIKTIFHQPETKPNESTDHFPYTIKDVENLDWVVKHREEIFPHTQREICFDNAGAPSASEPYNEAIREFTQRERLGYARHHAELIQNARKEVAQLFGCADTEVAFTQNTATGINIVAEGIDWKPGDGIIVMDPAHEYPTNYVPWKQVQNRMESMRPYLKEQNTDPLIQLHTVGQDTGIVTPSEIEALLQENENIRLVSLSSVGWKNGHALDLKSIGKVICRENQIRETKGKPRVLFHVDGIQSVGAQPLNVKECQIDFLSCGSSKWLLAGSGNGIFYCAKNAIRALPLAPVGSDSLKDWKDAESGRRDDTAMTFETGALNQAGICGLGAAVELINRIGVVHIAKRIRELTDYLIEELKKRNFIIVSPEGDSAARTGMVIFSTKKWEQEKDIGKRTERCKEKMDSLLKTDVLFDSSKPKIANIEERGMAFSYRGGRPRISIHYYNTKEEIKELLRRLDEIK